MNDSIIKSLQQIYAMIPDIPCNHCHQCCGPIIWFEPEDILIKNYRQKMKIPHIQYTSEEFGHHNMQCPYLMNNRCRIYPVRPLVCRLQGLIPELPCTLEKRDTFLSSTEISSIKKAFMTLLHSTQSVGIMYSTRKISYRGRKVDENGK